MEPNFLKKLVPVRERDSVCDVVFEKTAKAMFLKIFMYGKFIRPVLWCAYTFFYHWSLINTGNSMLGAYHMLFLSGT